MKSKLVLGALLGATMMLSSCYTSTICVGNVKPDDPVTKIKSVNNPHLICGLVPLGQAKDAKEFVGNRENYMIKTKHTFVNMLLESITCGIYSPTTTNFYVPAGSK